MFGLIIFFAVIISIFSVSPSYAVYDPNYNPYANHRYYPNPYMDSEEEAATKKAARDLEAAQEESTRRQIAAQKESAATNQKIQIAGFLMLGAIGVFAVMKMDSRKSQSNNSFTKTCPNCGNVTSVNDSFCGSCGEKF